MVSRDLHRSPQDARARSRLIANRVLFVVTLAAIVLGVAMGQALITWLNATVLCLSCIGIR